ncbi:MAG: TonB-dependent receptor [Acidobacteriaceae bacterium]|nr:TonB-dependent receptor [Acidobacteriaceae bacterium]
MLSNLLLVSTGVCAAQSAQLSGLVRDTTQGVVPHASVLIENAATHVRWQGSTNESGLYLAPALAPGEYTLTVQAPGFQPRSFEHLRVQVAGKLSLDVTLHVGSDTQTVTVSTADLAINTTDATVSTVIDRQFVNNIPLNGRSFQSLLTAVPGVTLVPSSGQGESGEITVNGQRTEGNYFIVDGVAANTGASPSAIGYGAGFGGQTPNETVLGTTQSLLSVDALQEFRATTSSFSAENGRTPGGQFSIVSRSGTNSLHGTAFEYLRNEALDANNTFNKAIDQPRVAEKQNDFGGTIGGPIWLPRIYDGRSKSFFFYSYEGLRLRTPVAATLLGVPSASVRVDTTIDPTLRKILNAYPTPDAGTDRGNGLATSSISYSSPSQLDSSSLRLDHNINDHFHLFGRAAYTSSNIQTRNSGNVAVLNQVKGSTKLITLGATNIFTPRMTNDLRFNLTANNADNAASLTNFGGATPLDLGTLPGFADPAHDSLIFNIFYDLHALTYVAPAATRQRQINAIDTFTASLGRHTLHAGFDYRRLLTSESRPELYEFAYTLTEAGLRSNTMSAVIAQKYSGSMRPTYNNYGAFLQDEWTVTPRLSLSYGLRWDVNPAPHDDSGNDPYAITTADPRTAAVAPKGTALWKTRYGNFAPRFGLAYRVHETPGHETVLRAGGGLFYDLGPANASQGYSGLGSSATSTVVNAAFPLTQTQVDAIPAPNVAAPYAASVYATNPNLSSPYSFQWNAAIEQGLGANQTLKLTYVGSAGHQLYLSKQYIPYYLGNANFGTAAYLILTNNGASSNYNSLQVQFDRHLSRGLQMLASYTWSHSLDDASNNLAVYTQLRGASDFDIRNNFELALTYDIPGHYGNRAAAALLQHWSVVSRITARSAPPIDLIGYTTIGAGSGNQLNYHPNVVANQPVYLYNHAGPSRRQINPAAFTAATTTVGGVTSYVEGNSGRNSVRGYDAAEANVAVQRDIPFHGAFGLLFRVEAFNVLNHPIYGGVYNNLTVGSTLFGTASGTLNNQLGGLNSLYQTGGPRSLQAALKLHF